MPESFWEGLRALKAELPPAQGTAWGFRQTGEGAKHPALPLLPCLTLGKSLHPPADCREDSSEFPPAGQPR